MQIAPTIFRSAFIILFTILGADAQLIFTQSGKVDRGFGTNGFANFLTPAGRGTGLLLDSGVAFAATPIFVASTDCELAISKQMPDGSADSSFGQNGIGRVRFARWIDVRTIAVQPDGKILAGGYIDHDSSSMGNDFLIVRFLSTGQLDTSFGNSGYVTQDIAPDTSAASDYSNDTVGSIIVLDDETILVSGTSEQMFVSTSQTRVKAILLKYSKDGILDPAFGVGGIVTTTMATNPVLNSGSSPLLLKKLSSGKFFAGMGVRIQTSSTDSQPAMLLRYLSDGTLDTSFGIDGKIDLSSGGTDRLNWRLKDIGELANHKLLILTGGALDRLNADGTFDMSFGDHGRVFVGESPFSFTELADGSIFTVGSLLRNTQLGYKSIGELRHYSSNGSPDVRFGVSGKAYLISPGYDTYVGFVRAAGTSKVMIMGQRDAGYGAKIFRSLIMLNRKF